MGELWHDICCKIGHFIVLFNFLLLILYIFILLLYIYVFLLPTYRFYFIFDHLFSMSFIHIV